MKPPPFERLVRPAGRPALLTPWWWLAGGAALSFAASAALSFQWPLPQCAWRLFTGIPCPTCGCTRSLAAWADLDLGRALQFNPLFFLLSVGLILWAALRLMELLARRSILARLRRPAHTNHVWKLGIFLLTLNWLYLCLCLPK